MKRCFLLPLYAVALLARNESEAPVQPLPFSHKQHADAAKLKCADCHRLSAEGEVATIPKAGSCMGCHRSVKANSSAIRALRTYADANRPIPWNRVYELPAFVNFSHKVHLDAGASCESCHGPVAQRDRLWRETDISMQGCVTCHQSHKATTDCGSCHDLSH